LGPTQVAELKEDGSIAEGMITPGQLGLGPFPADELAGGTPKENAQVVKAVLEGQGPEGARAAVLLNAAGALYVAGRGESLLESMALAADGLDSGAGVRKLDELREATNSV
jgi:anthranilate phosphoribosyltransferase